jgi:hypothetical protein
MIRRGFWLLAGAALGVTGYRKATRLVRTLTGQGLPGGPAATEQRRAVRLGATHALSPGRAQSQLVPQQLALLARKPAPVKPTPVKPAARIAAAATRASAAAGFVRDVRDGMAEYWDLHRSEPDHTLGSQRDHIWSGDGPQGPREH